MYGTGAGGFQPGIRAFFEERGKRQAQHQRENSRSNAYSRRQPLLGKQKEERQQDRVKSHLDMQQSCQDHPDGSAPEFAVEYIRQHQQKQRSGRRTRIQVFIHQIEPRAGDPDCK